MTATSHRRAVAAKSAAESLAENQAKLLESVKDRAPVVGAAVPLPPAPEVPQGVDVQAMIAQLVPALREEIRKELVAQQVAEQMAATQPAPVPDAPTFKKTYRCDQTPYLLMQKYDFIRAMETGKPHTKFPINGETIEFKDGIFRTNDDNEIAQIEWSRTHPILASGDTFHGRILGGNPTIYEDSTVAVIRCRACEFSTTSRDVMNAHARATHGLSF